MNEFTSKPTGTNTSEVVTTTQKTEMCAKNASSIERAIDSLENILFGAELCDNKCQELPSSIDDLITSTAASTEHSFARLSSILERLR